MTDTTEAEVDPSRVRKPPAGLTRAERSDWREEEAQRIADVQDQARTGGFRAIKATAPPKGLGRAGRKVWREADRANRSHRVAAEAVSSESDRYVGALILMVGIGVVVAWRVVSSGSTPDPVTPPIPPPAVTYQAAPAVPTTPAPTTAAAASGPQDVLLAWFTIVCPSTPDDPQSSRLTRVASLMTPDAWAAIDHTPTAAGATWSCSNITATVGPSDTAGAVVYYTADVTGDRGTQTLRATRTVQLQGGVWLVGPLTTAG